MYKAQTPAKEAQEALEVREDPEVKVEVPVDQVGRKGLTSKFSLASRRFCALAVSYLPVLESPHGRHFHICFSFPKYLC